MAPPHLRRRPLTEPTEELAADDFTYSEETTTAFQELLTLIDSSTRELPSVLSPAHYAALTQLPLTYPWARLVLDLKELLISFDRHLLTCLIANNVQGNAIPHPGTVLSSFLQHLAQLLLLIIAPFHADDPPPFLHPEIYGLEFWHAHLNYACTRFSSSHGSDRLLGNQICHWTTGTCETCMKVTHLVVFLPPALGAYVLSQHRSKVSSSLSAADAVPTQDEPHTLRINQSSLLTPPAVIHHQGIASNPTPSPFLPTHRHGLVKIVSHGSSNLRCQYRSYSPVFRRSERVWSKWCTSTRRGRTLCLALQLLA